MQNEAKKYRKILKEGLKSSILGPQNLGSGGAWVPGAHLDPLVDMVFTLNDTDLDIALTFELALVDYKYAAELCEILFI